MIYVLLMNTKPLKSSIKFLNYFELCLTINILMVCSYFIKLGNYQYFKNSNIIYMIGKIKIITNQ